MDMSHRYKLDAGTQVREEDFGLLFYTRKGPRLYFLPSGRLLSCEFFQGESTLTQWLESNCENVSVLAGKEHSLRNALTELTDKGVVIEF
jgi:putative mycofactocin binding protein MftB